MLHMQIANFFAGKKEYRSLSNFWENDVTIIDGIQKRVYESGEHCFHGEKYIRIAKLSNDENEDETRKFELLRHGMTFLKPSIYKTSADAKKMGGKKGLRLTTCELDKWANLSIVVQEDICRWKVENYDEVRNDLVKSGDKILIHPALRCSEDKIIKSGIWVGKGIIQDGKVVVLGQNLLGKIWMDIRDKILQY